MQRKRLLPADGKSLSINSDGSRPNVDAVMSIYDGRFARERIRIVNSEPLTQSGFSRHSSGSSSGQSPVMITLRTLTASS